ncbi:NADH-quinone oxidoreductase subunit J [Candidatus Bealeia paramacronuclearis]|uniref:NADH-quinone oxidoreductase subunit J n=1 Tax=Candidatus Bealeia paramacronuclearis TaxID=1921001 RepID=UPI0039C0854D
MDLSALSFYMFSGLMLGSALMTISSKNTVHSVLWLILAFFNAAGLFVLLQAEFLAMLLVIVYVGAVAVLFLFVVMMLNVNVVNVKESMLKYKTLGVVIGSILVAELILVSLGWTISPEAVDLTSAPQALFHGKTNTEALANLLYTHYAFPFQISGLILLVAMIGAIVLTLRHREGVRRQKIYDQVSRRPQDTLQVLDVPFHKGVDL